MAKRNLNADEVLNIYTETESAAEVGKVFGVSRNTIVRLLKKNDMWENNLDRKDTRTTKVCKGCKNRVNKQYFYPSAKSKDALVSECNVCYKSRLNDLLNKNKLTIEILQQLYLKYKSLYKVSTYVGFSEHTVKVILDIHGLLDITKNEIKTADKYCGTCNIIKPIVEFEIYGDNLYRSICKKCRKIKSKEYRQNNKHIVKKWRKNNTEHIRAYSRNYVKNRCKTDIEYRIKISLRKRMSSIVRAHKKGSAVSDLGCSIGQLRGHLEKQFYSHPISGESMSWDNYGLYGWHIDHIKPLSAFNLLDRKQFLKACHYTNLQPLWAEDNLKKGANYG